MKVVSSPCIILKNQDYKERDRLVTFLTRDKGGLTGIARGSRKLNARGLGTYEPYTRGTIFYTEKQGSGLVGIRKCDPLPPHLLLHANYEVLLYASYMAELISFCRISQEDALCFFTLLETGLSDLIDQHSPIDFALLRLRFELDFLICLGVQPDWSRCISCGTSLFSGRRHPPRLISAGVHQLDLRLGGVRCPQCPGMHREKEALSAGSLAFLGAWRGGGRAGGNVRPTRQALLELERAMTGYLVYQLEREPRSLALLPPLEQSRAP